MIGDECGQESPSPGGCGEGHITGLRGLVPALWVSSSGNFLFLASRKPSSAPCLCCVDRAKKERKQKIGMEDRVVPHLHEQDFGRTVRDTLA